MLKLIRRGGGIYALVYAIWRSWKAFPRIIFTGLYRHALQTCGAGSTFARGVYIADPKQIRFGEQCYVGVNAQLGSELSTGFLNCGDQVQISEGCWIDYSGGVTIGDRTLISANVRIYSHDHGYDPRSIPQPAPLTIAEDVWIGVGAIILPSTKVIGRRAIVGAGAVVTKPIPENSIVAGNPARVIKVGI